MITKIIIRNIIEILSILIYPKNSLIKENKNLNYMMELFSLQVIMMESHILSNYPT